MRLSMPCALAAGALWALAGGAGAQTLDDTAALALMKKAGCASCHSVDRKGVGPAYKDVAAKRKGQKDAAAVMAEKVRKGGSGVYGPVPMPANPAATVSDDEIRQMVAWVLTK
jgi:cytochrome c